MRTFRKCAVAVRIGNGLVDVQLLNTAVRNCSIGIYTMIDTIGSIVMSGNVIGGTGQERGCFRRVVAAFGRSTAARSATGRTG